MYYLSILRISSESGRLGYRIWVFAFRQLTLLEGREENQLSRRTCKYKQPQLGAGAEEIKQLPGEAQPGRFSLRRHTRRKAFNHHVSRAWKGHHPRMLSRYVRLFTTPWTVARQAPLSLGFSRQEYWSGFPFPPPGDLPNPRSNPCLLPSPALAGGFFSTESPGKPWWPSLYDKHTHLFLSGDSVGLCPNS